MGSGCIHLSLGGNLSCPPTPIPGPTIRANTRSACGSVGQVPPTANSDADDDDDRPRRAAAEVLPTPSAPRLSTDYDPDSIVNQDYIGEDGDEVDLSADEMLALINQLRGDPDRHPGGPDPQGDGHRGPRQRGAAQHRLQERRRDPARGVRRHRHQGGRRLRRLPGEAGEPGRPGRALEGARRLPEGLGQDQGRPRERRRRQRHRRPPDQGRSGGQAVGRGHVPARQPGGPAPGARTWRT